MTKLGRDVVYMKREFVSFSQGFSKEDSSMYLKHSIYKVIFACSYKFEITKF